MKIGTDGVLLGAWAAVPGNGSVVADIGAGCGIVGLMVAQRHPGAEVTFVEIDSGAVADLELNIAGSPFAARCRVAAGDFRDIDIGRPDMIVSNPPFFETGELSPDSARAAARHSGALSPLSLVDYAAARLAPGGVMAMIIPVGTFAAVEERAAFARMSTGRVCLVTTAPGKEPRRVMIELVNGPARRSVSSLAVRDAAGEWTSEYRRLTCEFHINV